MYKAKELRDQSLEDLEATLVDSRRKLFDLVNAFNAQKKREKPHEIKHVKKDIARVLTVLGQKSREKQKS